MELQPGRAPIMFEDDFTPLRTPKTTSNPMMVHDMAQSMQQMHLQQQQQRVSLSPFAKEFVPQNYSTLGMDGAVGSSGSGSGQQQQHQQQYQHQPNRYTNGYNQQNQYEQQVQQQQQQQHHQQQQQIHYQQSQQEHLQMYPTMQSVQDRLTYYQQNPNTNQQQQPQTTNLHHQQQQSQQQQQFQHHQHNNNQHHHHHQQQQQQQQQQQKYQQQQRHQQNFQHQHNSTKYSRHSQQQRLNQQQHGHSNADSSENNDQSSVEQIALEYLKTVMECLDQNPGQFDTVAPRFINIYEGLENNQYVLAIAMEDIFEQSVSNPNFRYMGAKLYNLLHMLNPKPDSLFHLLLKCKLDFQQSQIVEYLNNHQSNKVRETALFLAELYMQLRCGGDETQRIQLIAENIIYALQQLLQATIMEKVSAKEAADNVRCICLTLKLAGYDLTKDCGIDMLQIIAQLEQIDAQSPGKYPLATNVINLQKNNWGRKTSCSSSISEQNGASGDPSCPLRVSDEPIFYGPDGRELTAEESEFLTNGVAPESSTDDEYGVGADLDVEYDLEMDEETEKAYIEFCKQNAAK